MTPVVVVLLFGGLFFFLVMGATLLAARVPRPVTIFITAVSLILLSFGVYRMGEGHPRDSRWLDANEVCEVVVSFSAGKSQIVALRKVGAAEDDFVIYEFSKPQELPSKYVVVTGPKSDPMLKPFLVESTAPTTQPVPPDKK